MGYEENNPADISSDKVYELIEPFFSEINRSDITFFYHGTYNVFIVKDEYFFRFPDKSLYNQIGYNFIQREVQFLNLIRDSVSLEIPNPLFISEDPNNPFVGYKKIPGISLSRVYKKTTPEERKKIAKKVGNFLTEYHSDKIKDKVRMRKYGEDIFNTQILYDEWSEYFLKTKKLVYPLIDESKQEWLEQLFARFLLKENFEFTTTLTHGDFDTSNILVNPKNFDVTGIIDFEEAKIADPAYDLIFFDEGEIFTNTLFKNYRGHVDSTMNLRRKFYYSRAGTIYIITGLEWKYPKMIEYGHKLLEEKMKIFPL